MVKTEILPSGLVRTYSDTPGMGLLQTDTGAVYSEAVDIPGSGHAYEETPVETPEPDPDAEMREKAMAYDMIARGEENV